MTLFIGCLIVSGFFFFHSRMCLISDLKNLVLNDKYYPKHYIKPRKWMKKFLRMNYKLIPKHIYYDAVFIFLYWLIGLLGGMFSMALSKEKIQLICMLLLVVLAAAERIVIIVLGNSFGLYGYENRTLKRRRPKEKDNTGDG